MAKANILITGGSGLIGNRLTEILIEKGYKVSFLSRKENLKDALKKYKWDPSTKYINQKAFENIDHIIHLAGAGIADERWTDERKKEILNSRVESTRLLFESLHKLNTKVKTIVSASAIGYYGFDVNDKPFEESDKPATDFLAHVTQLWEKEVDKIASLGIRIAKLRIGVVLTEKGGALPQMALPIKFFAGSALGSGNQMISWIDLEDLCNLFVFAIENPQMNGAYNAVAPNPVSNKIFTETIAKILNRPVWPINIPIFLLKIVLGEMAMVVTGNCEVKNKRIAEETDFKYQFTHLEPCLQEHLK
ncbi:MAG: TIGR01777 family oxidoreductase [Bacteroidota bacterium]